MSSRMDRYKSLNDSQTSSRSDKNKNLYTSLAGKARYTTLADIENSNAVLLTGKEKKIKTRESYQKTKDYGNLDFVEYNPIKKELEDFNYIYQERGNRVYDINTAIEEAKKNRSADEEIGNKKIDISKFFLTEEEIEKYKKIRNKEIVPAREDVKEIIHTITSKTLRGEIDHATSVDLLSDLMAVDGEDRIEGQKDASFSNTRTEMVDEALLEKVKEQEKNYTPLSKEEAMIRDMDQSFYTRSMDLSDKDFDLGMDFVEEKKVPNIFKFFLFVLLVLLVAVLIYFIVQSI